MYPATGGGEKKTRLGVSEAGHRCRSSYYRAACLGSGFWSDFFGERRPIHTITAQSKLNTASANIIPDRLLSLRSVLSTQLRCQMIAEGFPTTRRIPSRSVGGITTSSKTSTADKPKLLPHANLRSRRAAQTPKPRHRLP